MRTLCDVCERAAALYFCAADEAALCQDCDDKVHLCNKLASRHVRVAIASPSAVPRCDICENSPAFFYCEIDGSSLCLQCDTAVHVGGKRTHERYLMLRQKVEFPGDKLTEKLVAYEDQESQPVAKSGNKKEQNQAKQPNTSRNNITNGLRHNQEPTVPTFTSRDDRLAKADSEMIDLNACPQRGQGQPSNSGQV